MPVKSVTAVVQSVSSTCSTLYLPQGFLLTNSSVPSSRCTLHWAVFRKACRRRGAVSRCVSTDWGAFISDKREVRVLLTVWDSPRCRKEVATPPLKSLIGIFDAFRLRQVHGDCRRAASGLSLCFTERSLLQRFNNAYLCSQRSAEH